MHGCGNIREPRLRAIGRFRISGTGLRILCQWHLDSAFFELYSGFPTPTKKKKHFLDSGFQKQKFPGLRNPDSVTWGERNVLAGRAEG